MKMAMGKYIGCDLMEIPTSYLEWAVGHLAVSDDMERAVVAEIARRSNASRVEAETPAQRLKERVGQSLTKFAAKHGL